MPEINAAELNTSTSKTHQTEQVSSSISKLDIISPVGFDELSKLLEDYSHTHQLAPLPEIQYFPPNPYDIPALELTVDDVIKRQIAFQQEGFFSKARHQSAKITLSMVNNLVFIDTILKNKKLLLRPLIAFQDMHKVLHTYIVSLAANFACHNSLLSEEDKNPELMHITDSLVDSYNTVLDRATSSNIFSNTEQYGSDSPDTKLKKLIVNGCKKIVSQESIMRDILIQAVEKTNRDNKLTVAGIISRLLEQITSNTYGIEILKYDVSFIKEAVQLLQIIQNPYATTLSEHFSNTFESPELLGDILALIKLLENLLQMRTPE